MINNYKAQRNVRAELGGAVDLGEPVSLYIAEDEIEYSSKNLATNGKFQDGTVTPFTTGTGSVQMDVVEVAANPVSGRTSLRLLVGDANDVAQGDFNVSVGKTYKFSFNRTIPNHDNGSKCKFRLGIPGNVNAYADIVSFTSNATTGVFRESLVFTATNSTLEFRIGESGNENDAEIFIDDIQLYEVVDHSYKLMAIKDTIPSQSVDTDAVGSELGTNGTFESNADDWIAKSTTLSHETSAPITGSGSIKATNSASTYGGPYQNMSLDSTKNYKVTGKMQLISGSSNGRVTIYTSRSNGTGQEGAYEGSAGELVAGGSEVAFDVVISPTESDRVSIQFAVQVSDGVFLVDDVSVKEVYGYDYYNAPAYKFGIVSSVYDQSTGAMKTTGAAGDEVEVTVQGECNLRGPNGSATKDKLLSRIGSNGDPTDLTVADAPLPNSVGVMTETVSGDTTFPIILFQGVEFSEHFVHKNSLQVHAKCAETITKFRPVSLYLDSEGDLLCRHDDIPEERPDTDTDHTGVDPGKWGISELGGVSGDIIPVTVAGKTHMNTSTSVVEGRFIQQLKEEGSAYQQSVSNGILPNALGTYLADGPGDVPITIFGGTPIGTITDWKRTIKVTAKANGTIDDFCPVSLYLDQYGNYKCISDTIPVTNTSFDNGVWCDFRKWGVAQNNASDGEDVEIIVQGRTKVRNSIASVNKGEFVRKISSSGTVVGIDGTGYALSSLGIVEKESKISDGAYGVIIIF